MLLRYHSGITTVWRLEACRSVLVCHDSAVQSTRYHWSSSKSHRYSILGLVGSVIIEALLSVDYGPD